MTDPMKAVGQAVEQEAANELVRTQAHLLLGIAVSVIAPFEADGSVGQTDEAAVRNGDAVGVAAEIGKDMLG